MHIDKAAPQPSTFLALLQSKACVGDKKVGSKRFWTNKEIETVATFYPTEGLEACVARLPGRTAGAIYQQWLKLEPAKKRTRKYARWTTTPQLDDVIRQVFLRGKTSRDDIKAFALRIGRPYWWVRKRGRILTNTAAPRFREKDWKPAEIAILEDNARFSDEVIARKLAKAGFKRSVIAVHVKAKRIHADRSDPHHFTAHAFAMLLGVDGKTPTTWIEKGWLVASRRGTARTAQQGGDQHWIHHADAWRFIVENPNLIDLRKVDRHWFIDFLAKKPK